MVRLVMISFDYVVLIDYPWAIGSIGWDQRQVYIDDKSHLSLDIEFSHKEHIWGQICVKILAINGNK